MTAAFTHAVRALPFSRRRLKYSGVPPNGSSWPTMVPASFSIWTVVLKLAVGRSTTSASICFALSASRAASFVSYTAVSVVGTMTFWMAS